MLVIFSGLPAVGKSSIARELARQMGATYLRVDTIEQTIRESGNLQPSLEDAGYRIAYAVAEENLRLGGAVVADSVNPLNITRDAWVAVVQEAEVAFLEVEIWCSDQEEHQRRVEHRVSDIPGLSLPTWDEVVSREYHEWDRARLLIDTARNGIDDCVRLIRQKLSGA